ncbi:MAG: type II toxin-antitoxin system PemK/MazF family toxin [Trueperaceae bacterium]|nr:type II toxin-antitoxin system PemK/MazF family toxin [Trueperaceae bacterium]
MNRFEVHLVTLDPTRGSEIRKTRPCLIVSPNEMNRHVRTVLVAPMTTGGKAYPTRVPVRFRGREAVIVLDQLRTVDKERVVESLGSLDEGVQDQVIAVLQQMFAR